MLGPTSNCAINTSEGKKGLFIIFYIFLFIHDNEAMVSFDITSLFTSERHQKDDLCTPDWTKLDIDDARSLSVKHYPAVQQIILFTNDKIYKQIHGCAIGSPAIHPRISFTIEHESNCLVLVS